MQQRKAITRLASSIRTVGGGRGKAASDAEKAEGRAEAERSSRCKRHSSRRRSRGTKETMMWDWSGRVTQSGRQVDVVAARQHRSQVETLVVAVQAAAEHPAYTALGIGGFSDVASSIQRDSNSSSLQSSTLNSSRVTHSERHSRHTQLSNTLQQHIAIESQQHDAAHSNRELAAQSSIQQSRVSSDQ